MGGQVRLLHIVPDHAVRAEGIRNSGSAPQSTLHPTAWESLTVSREKFWDEFVFQYRVEGLRVCLVAGRRA